MVTGVLICNRMKLPSTDLEKRNGIIFNHFLTPWFYQLRLVFMRVKSIPLNSRHIVSHSMLNTAKLAAFTCSVYMYI